MFGPQRAVAMRGGFRSISYAAIVALLLAPAASAVAQVDTSGLRRDTTRTLTTVTVIGSRSDIAEAREKLLNVAGGVAMVPISQIRDSRQANLHDALSFVPGVYIQPRFGAADESQISIRGSGLRNNFHARGVNLLVNGMPYRNADGFTDFESLEILTSEAMEVYKGANALRYGGSTLGGAVNLFTQTGYTAPPITAFLQGGSQDFTKAQVATGGTHDNADWYASYANTRLDGYRDWSDQRRDRVNLHAGLLLGRATDLRTFYFFAHVREHLPGSLTEAQFDADPAQADATNAANRWGRVYDLHHVGIQLRTQLTPTQRLEISPYLQYRDIDHPIFEVISQLSHDWGVEARYENVALLGDHENRLTIGVQPAYETMLNKQFQNAQGSHGALTRNEHDFATTLAVYAENRLSLTPTVSAVAGFRAERATRRVDDFFLSNGDQTDRRTYSAVTPRLGITMQLQPELQLFANASRTAEPPLLLELSSFGNPGGFIGLKSQKAWQYEVGARKQAASGVSAELSLYDIELDDELLNQNVQPFPAAPFTVPTYRNVPRSRHSGVELGLGFERDVRVFARGSERLGGRLSYMYNRFRFLDDPTYAGNALPGAPSHYVSAEVKYSSLGHFSVAPSVEWVPQSYFVTSANDASNGAWKTFGVRAEYLVTRFGATIFAQGLNLANARYSASVQVDNAAGKFYEPADPRSFYTGLRWTR